MLLLLHAVIAHAVDRHIGNVEATVSIPVNSFFLLPINIYINRPI